MANLTALFNRLKEEYPIVADRGKDFAIALQVTNLSKGYGFSKALSEVSFD